MKMDDAGASSGSGSSVGRGALGHDRERGMIGTSGHDRERGMIGTSAFLFSRVLHPQSHEEVASWWGGEGNVVVAE